MRTIEKVLSLGMISVLCLIFAVKLIGDFFYRYGVVFLSGIVFGLILSLGLRHWQVSTLPVKVTFIVMMGLAIFVGIVLIQEVRKKRKGS